MIITSRVNGVIDKSDKLQTATIIVPLLVIIKFFFSFLFQICSLILEGLANNIN